jgi:hypothetical protein
MKELYDLSEKLENELNQKDKELQGTNDSSIYLAGNLENRKIDVLAFTNSIKHVSKDPFLKNEIIKNYKNAAKKIIEEIRQIK